MKKHALEENIFQDTVDPSEHERQREAVEVTPSLGSERMIEKLGVLDNAINHDEVLTSEDMMALDNVLENKDIKVLVGGQEFTIGELEKVAEENKEIWDEICSGNFRNFEKLTFVTPEIATYLVEKKTDLCFRNLTILSAPVAEILSKIEDKKNLSFKVTKISDEVAEHLSKHVGTLFLSEVTELSDKAAELLSHHDGTISLGPTHLSSSAAESLSNHKGYSLSLNGLTEISDEIAEFLSKYKGRSLDLNGLTEFSDKAAEYFANFKGTHLELNGLTHISDSVAEHLSKTKAYLDFRGVKSISDSVAAHFANFKGDQLGFHSLSHLSDLAAEYLSKSDTHLHLDEVSGLSEKAAEHLSRCKSGIDFQRAPEAKRMVEKYKQQHGKTN